MLILFTSGCCKDEELLLSKTPYTGNELRIDGYYYYIQDEPYGVSVKFLYRNGIELTSYFINSSDFYIADKELLTQYNYLKEDKSRWGVFEINNHTIQFSAWSTSVGGGLPTYITLGVIDNDTTFRITKSINSDGTQFETNKIYHFRQFSSKPDSTNNFIR